MSEFELIASLAELSSTDETVAIGIGDDAAVLELGEGKQLVSATDTLLDGVHFDHHFSPADIAWKAVAVNLSDLAAMGAEPKWLLLALSMPQADRDWFDAFVQGLGAACEKFGVSLVGGDTTRGSLMVSITALGEVPQGQALRRSGARPGDGVWVTGQLGGPALALALQRTKQEPPTALREALLRPQPQLKAGIRLRALASACIDISDGFAADLGHLLTASEVGAKVQLDQLPCPGSVMAEEECWALALNGGDDYQLCFTLPSSKAAQLVQDMKGVDCPVTQVGWIDDKPGLRLFHHQDRLDWKPQGFDHFG